MSQVGEQMGQIEGARWLLGCAVSAGALPAAHATVCFGAEVDLRASDLPPPLPVLQAAAGLWTFVNEEQAWEGPYTVAELRQLVKQ